VPVYEIADLIQIGGAFWQNSLHESQRSRQDRTGKKQAHLRHSTTLMLENKGFLKAQGTIYPIRLYRFWHDESKILACIGAKTPLRAGPGRFRHFGKMPGVDMLSPV
jgi:hypothetical protein